MGRVMNYGGGHHAKDVYDENGCAPTITTGNHGLGVEIMVDCELAGSLNKYGFAQADNVWSVKGVCPTVLAYNGGQIGHQINILEEDDDG